jgi:adenylate cyclase
MVSGNYIPFRKRPVASRYPVFPLQISQGQSAWCYVRVRNDDVEFPISVWDDRAFRTADHDEQLVIGLVLGLFIIVILFNALFYIAMRDGTYLSYVLFVLFYALFELAIRDIGGEYLWPRNTWIDDAVQVSAGSLCITMGIIFARSFLQTKLWAPVMHRFLGALTLIGAANTLCTLLFPYVIMTQVSNAFPLVSASVLFLNAFMVLRRGYRAARFYLAAWVLLLPGGIVFALFNVGLIPITLYTMNALSLGATTEVVILFLAIVDRILLMRRESEKLQRERLEAMEKRLYSDTLTERPNRNRLIRDPQPERFVTVVLVNIDHFKEINDLLGQKAGDHVIRELGERIHATVAGRGGAVYRLHADEFAVVIEHSCTEDELTELGRSSRRAARTCPISTRTRHFASMSASALRLRTRCTWRRSIWPCRWPGRERYSLSTGRSSR